MQEYYNQNYKSYDVFINHDFIRQRIFSVTHDQHQDLVYIFVGRIKQLSGKKLVHVKFPKSRKQKILIASQTVEEAIYEQSKEFRNIKIEMELERAKEHAMEIEALKVYAECTVEFSLYLQVWNLDDRVMIDSDHRKRPIVEVLTLRTNMQFPESTTSFCQMNAC